MDRKRISDKMKENFKNGTIKGWAHINTDKNRRSYPEKFFIDVFTNNELYDRFDIQEKYPYGRYFIDFLFVDIKLIVEVDGEQHFRDEESIKHDRERDEYFINEGFKIYRVRWKDVCNNTKSEIEEILKFICDIDSNSIRKYNINECKYLKKKRVRKKRVKSKKCNSCDTLISNENDLCRCCWVESVSKKDKKLPVRKNKCISCNSPIYGISYCKVCSQVQRRKIERPDIGKLKIEIDELGYSAVGRKYGVSDNAIRKWIKYGSLV